MVLRGVRDILCNTYNDRWIGRGGHISRLPRFGFESSGFFLWEHLKSLAYAAPIDNEEALHRRIVDARQTIRNYCGGP